MQRSIKNLSICGILAIACHCGLVPANTFAYHGSLQDAGKPAEGGYDLELTLYSAQSGGTVLGGPLMLYAVPVHGGSFSVQADFGRQQRLDGPTWLGVRVRTAGDGEFVALPTRTWVAAEAAASVCPGAWTLNGNAGNPAGSYLGTADAQPLVLEMNAAQVARFAGATGTSGTNLVTGTNVLLGDPNNSIGFGSVGATVSGGGTFAGTDYPQVVGPGAHWATISGGIHHTASGFGSTVCGGDTNTAQGTDAVACGGAGNSATGDFAVVGGGIGNVAGDYGATVAGGHSNTASNGDATVAGGKGNVASGQFSSVAGGYYNSAGGDYSFAAGVAATVRDATQANSPSGCGPCGDFSTFVWSDGTSLPFVSTGPNQFLIHSIGGVGINTSAPLPDTLTVAAPYGPITGFSPQPGTGLVVEGNGTTFMETASPAANKNGLLFSLVGMPADGGIVYNNGGARSLELRTGGNVIQVTIDSAGNTFNHSGSWSTYSDIRLKRDVAAIEHPLDTFLGLRGQTFEYVDPTGVMASAGRRMGFIAQDVEQVLPEWVSDDVHGYKMVTTQGFEALSVEAVRALREEKDREIGELRARLDELAARLATLETLHGQ